MNRAVTGVTLFQDEGDYAAFERVLGEARERSPAMRVCAYCLMPNHFHLVLWPREDELLSTFMQWLTMTHTQRWHAHRQSVGRGHLYQGRFKSFPIEQDKHFLTVCRYVERNALRAGLVERAEEWRWGSLGVWVNGRAGESSGAKALGLEKGKGLEILGAWPVERPRNWVAAVNRPESKAELEALRRCVVRGSPYGGEAWCAKAAGKMGLESTMRKRGRPRKDEAGR
jgi:putative transposase